MIMGTKTSELGREGVGLAPLSLSLWALYCFLLQGNCQMLEVHRAEDQKLGGKLIVAKQAFYAVDSAERQKLEFKTHRGEAPW